MVRCEPGEPRTMTKKPAPMKGRAFRINDYFFIGMSPQQLEEEPQDEPQHPPQGQHFLSAFMSMWNEKMTVSNANEPSGAPAMNVPSGKKCVLYAAYNVIRVTRA